MGNEMFIIVAIACIGYIVAEQSLPNDIKDFFFIHLELNKYSFFAIIYYMLSCCLCVSFWLCLAITWDFYSAFICGVLSELIAKTISYER